MARVNFADVSDHPADDRAIALSEVPAAGSRRGLIATGVLKYFYGPMDCGKSTLALQFDYNNHRQGRRGLLLIRLDHSGCAQITSRMGIVRPAINIELDTDLADLVRAAWSRGNRVDYLVVDEAQFLTGAQVDQLAQLADEAAIDVYCFGIASDFRTKLFPGSARLFEIADEVVPLQVEVLCWCGRPARFNSRVVDGQVMREGEQVMVGNTAGHDQAADEVRYQVLCRIHMRAGDLGPDAELRLPLA